MATGGQKLNPQREEQQGATNLSQSDSEGHGIANSHGTHSVPLLSDYFMSLPLRKKGEHILKKRSAAPRWNPVKELINRENNLCQQLTMTSGHSSRKYGSIHLETKSNLSYHKSNVTSIDFNRSGQRLVSGGSDMSVAVWQLNNKSPVAYFISDHTYDITQAKFLTQNDDYIVTASRDGRVYLTDWTNTPEKSKLLLAHERSASGISVDENRPFEVLSCGRDSEVYSIDVRNKPSRLLSCRYPNGTAVSLNSIDQDPRSHNRICITADDSCVRIYDRRMNACFHTYRPSYMERVKLMEPAVKAIYSRNGDCILASYRKDHLYLFSTDAGNLSLTETHMYCGQWASDIDGGISFFEKDNYLLFGSSCGHMFIFDRITEAVVNCVKSDKEICVSAICVHPTEPIIATGGYDKSVRMWAWAPVDVERTIDKLHDIVTSNLEKYETTEYLPPSQRYINLGNAETIYNANMKSLTTKQVENLIGQVAGPCPMQ